MGTLLLQLQRTDLGHKAWMPMEDDFSGRAPIEAPLGQHLVSKPRDTRVGLLTYSNRELIYFCCFKPVSVW